MAVKKVDVSKYGNVHQGHRKRMRKQFIEDDKAFNDHQLLELFLFGSIPRKDTNVTAHYLINEFGSLKGVLDASYEELLTVPGIGSKSAQAIKSLMPAMRAATSMSEYKLQFNEPEFIAEYLLESLSDKPAEQIWLYTIDNQLHVMRYLQFTVGGIDEFRNRLLEMLQFIVKGSARRLLLAHRVSGTCLPSREFSAKISELHDTLSSFSLDLIDYAVVGDDGVFLAVMSRYYPPAQEKQT